MRVQCWAQIVIVHVSPCIKHSNVCISDVYTLKLLKESVDSTLGLSMAWRIREMNIYTLCYSFFSTGWDYGEE